MPGCSEDAMSRNAGHVVLCWDVSKHIELSVGSAFALFHAVACLVPPSPQSPSTFPVLLAPFCYGWLGGGMQIPGWDPPLPNKSPFLPPLLGERTLMVLIHVSCHCTKGRDLL